MATTEVVDVAVVGAGVVGLAIARACAAAGRETILLERHAHVGTETSSRNSGVIHSGIYYPADSLKARLCVAGRDQLYAYCAERGIAHRRTGKLIVAQASQVEALRKLQGRGIANGVTDLRWLEADEVRSLEPEVRCAAGLFSPFTGIVDPHELMTALQGDFESLGGAVAVESNVIGIRRDGDVLVLEVESGGTTMELAARRVVTSAGLAAVDLARRTAGYPVAQIPHPWLAKGNYFACAGKPFRHLVYPMPNEAGLGVHATLDLDGSTRFGPDVEWTDRLDYAVDPGRADAFYAAIREYWPGLPDGALRPGHAGMRPKIAGPDQAAADFRIDGPAVHGIPGLVTLLGIESPGLTASLAMGAYVAGLVFS